MRIRTICTSAKSMPVPAKRCRSSAAHRMSVPASKWPALRSVPCSPATSASKRASCAVWFRWACSVRRANSASTKITMVFGSCPMMRRWASISVSTHVLTMPRSNSSSPPIAAMRSPWSASHAMCMRLPVRRSRCRRWIRLLPLAPARFRWMFRRPTFAAALRAEFFAA